MVLVIDLLAEEGHQDLHLGAVGSRGEVTRVSRSFQSIDSSSALYLDENLLMPQDQGLLGQDGSLVYQDEGLVGLSDALLGPGGLVSIRDMNFCGELVRGANVCVLVHKRRARLREQEEVFGEAVVDVQHVRAPIVDHVSGFQVRMEESSA